MKQPQSRRSAPARVCFPVSFRTLFRAHLGGMLLLASVACSVPAATASQDRARGTDHAAEPEGPAYPQTRRVSQVDTYHGTAIPDPYRWLEEMESIETRAWVKAQDSVLRDHLGDDAALARLEARLLAIQHFEAVGVPIRAGARTFSTRTPAGAMRPEIWLAEPGKAERRLSRVTDLFADGAQLSALQVSKSGRYVALLVVPADSSWGTLHVYDVDRDRLLKDRITGLRGGVQWQQDDSGFYYVGYGALAELRSGATPRTDIRFHRLGAAVAEDVSILRPGDSDDGLYGIRLTHDGRFLVITRFEGAQAREEILLYGTARPAAPPRPLIADVDATFSFEGSDGDRLFFRTNLGAPRYRLIAVDRRRPAREHWQELIPQSEHAITAVSEVGDALIVRYSVDARPKVSVFGLDGTHRYDVALPKIGWIGGFRDDRSSRHTDYSLTTMADPGTIYRLDLDTGTSTLQSRPSLAFDPDVFTIRQVFYPSQDGTRVPMFIAHHRAVVPSEKTPLFLYGYGHAGWSAFPWFQPRIVGWMELGGVYALPGLRGGGEYGADWQAAGTAEHKENTIADYLAAADWLVAEGYTSYPKLVMNGGSASGVLAGIAVTRRPEKVGAAMIDVPFLDMLRYHRFTVFRSWIRGYGSSEDPALFPVLHGYSPYHQLTSDRCYPPTLVQVGEVDETTPALHGYKFVAALQAAQGCAAPVLLKTAWGAKHSAGASRAQRAETWAQELVFLARAVEHDLSASMRTANAAH